ncbi:MAG TPA: alpha/beta hydrolase [Candidatus Binataceae bacterium]|jgi:pimeloyl-ACP methyl ester carboxylesterase|nr:alpha/beta hydrolase [Candidatus Binataceae bacterium]
METRRFLGADGIVLNCVDYGGAGRPPLLFIHGGAAHARWWDFVAPPLLATHHVLALDQRGHGDSEWTQEWGYGTRHYVADLFAIISGWDLGAPILVGHSMGGHNVMCYAGLHSETLRAMVAIDSPPSYPDSAVALLRDLADRPARRFNSRAEAIEGFRTIPADNIASREVLHHVAEHSFRQAEDGQWEYKSDRRTMIREPMKAWDGLARLQCPALFLKAEHSVLKDGLAERMVAAMPQGRLAVVPNSHHHVPLDNPAGLALALRQFIREIG